MYQSSHVYSESAEYTKPCSGRASGWHDIVTCQRLVCFIPCGRLSRLSVSFLLHVKYTLSYRIERDFDTDGVSVCLSVWDYVCIDNKKLISTLDWRKLRGNSNYRLNHPTIVKHYHPSIQFSRNVCLSYRRVVPFLIFAPYSCLSWKNTCQLLFLWNKTL